MLGCKGGMRAAAKQPLQWQRGGKEEKKGPEAREKALWEKSGSCWGGVGGEPQAQTADFDFPKPFYCSFFIFPQKPLSHPASLLFPHPTASHPNALIPQVPPSTSTLISEAQHPLKEQTHPLLGASTGRQLQFFSTISQKFAHKGSNVGVGLRMQSKVDWFCTPKFIP